MTPKKPVSIRMEGDLHEKLMAEAALRDISMGVLIGEKLLFLERLEDELNTLRRTVEAEFVGLHNRLDELGAGGHESNQSGSLSVQYETLLLLRNMNGAGVKGSVHKEMKRQGVPVFNPEKDKE